mmetsp:Transcript_1503/g.1931  ORF Transcript_1503/g.1931 Transcript_1503/m.1931 type:complete len:91 (+) Transcript_1503:332-604(+)
MNTNLWILRFSWSFNDNERLHVYVNVPIGVQMYLCIHHKVGFTTPSPVGKQDLLAWKGVSIVSSNLEPHGHVLPDVAASLSRRGLHHLQI